MSFFDVNILCEQDKDNFRTCSDLNQFRLEFVNLTDVCRSNGYPENFINNCFKKFLDNKCTVQEKMITMPNKPLFFKKISQMFSQLLQITDFT